MGKKVLLVNGSARKKNTYNILLQIGEILEAQGAQVEMLHLFDYEIKDCVGCEVCVRQKACAIADDMPELMQKIMDSDAVVFGSPVYRNGVTSKLKTFVDRTNRWVHKPETAGKPMMFAATTAATGIKETRRFFETFAAGLGARRGGFVARAGKKVAQPIAAKELAKLLALLDRPEGEYRPAMDEIVMFNVGKVLAMKSQGDDRRFWEERQWLDKKYYYPCKMNPAKKTFSGFMFKVLSKAMA